VVVNVFSQAQLLFRVEDTVAFEVHDIKRGGAWFGRKKGVFRPKLQWTLQP
jgi:hypothetical protein